MSPELNFSERFEESYVCVEVGLLRDEERQSSSVVRQTFKRQGDVSVGIGGDGDRENSEPMTARQVSQVFFETGRQACRFALTDQDEGGTNGGAGSLESLDGLHKNVI